MKRTLIAALAMGSVLAAGLALAEDPIVIKFSHVVAENTPKGQMANPRWDRPGNCRVVP